MKRGEVPVAERLEIAGVEGAFAELGGREAVGLKVLGSVTNLWDVVGRAGRKEVRHEDESVPLGSGCERAG